MRINIGKLAKVVGQIIVAAPVVIAAAKPVLDALKKPAKPGTPASPITGTAPGTGRPTLGA